MDSSLEEVPCELNGSRYLGMSQVERKEKVKKTEEQQPKRHKALSRTETVLCLLEHTLLPRWE